MSFRARVLDFTNTRPNTTPTLTLSLLLITAKSQSLVWPSTKMENKVNGVRGKGHGLARLKDNISPSTAGKIMRISHPVTSFFLS